MRLCMYILPFMLTKKYGDFLEKLVDTVGQNHIKKK